MTGKSQDVRPKITLAHSECKERDYTTRRSRCDMSDRLGLTEFCSRCRELTAHRKTR